MNKMIILIIMKWNINNINNESNNNINNEMIIIMILM